MPPKRPTPPNTARRAFCGRGAGRGRCCKIFTVHVRRTKQHAAGGDPQNVQRRALSTEPRDPLSARSCCGSTHFVAGTHGAGPGLARSARCVCVSPTNTQPVAIPRMCNDVRSGGNSAIHIRALVLWVNPLCCGYTRRRPRTALHDLCGACASDAPTRSRWRCPDCAMTCAQYRSSRPPSASAASASDLTHSCPASHTSRHLAHTIRTRSARPRWVRTFSVWTTFQNQVARWSGGHIGKCGFHREE